MKRFRFVVIDLFDQREYTGETEAISKHEARHELIDWYCCELGTEPIGLSIEVEEINPETKMEVKNEKSLPQDEIEFRVRYTRKNLVITEEEFMEMVVENLEHLDHLLAIDQELSVHEIEAIPRRSPADRERDRTFLSGSS